MPDAAPEHHEAHHEARHEAELFADDLKPGSELLAGQYEILSFLNAGGFGITYLARDSVHRTVVVKECFPNALCRRSKAKVVPRSGKHAAEFRTIVQCFLDEARSLAKILHPGIVGVHQVFEDNGTAYMAIDFIDGKDLLDILGSTDRAFAPDQVVTLLMQLLRAIEFIHQIGILHRDISPDNIMIDPAGKPVLIDFGAAAEQETPDSRIVTARQVVKDGYSPQELYLTGAEQTAASDLYALAATFYHVIAGKPPPSSQRRLAALAGGTPDPCLPLAGRSAGYPPGFLASIDLAMRVLQRDRLQSAGDWIALIEDALAQEALAQDELAQDELAREGLAREGLAKDGPKTHEMPKPGSSKAADPVALSRGRPPLAPATSSAQPERPGGWPSRRSAVLLVAGAVGAALSLVILWAMSR